jgi:hypothetical protein
MRGKKKREEITELREDGFRVESDESVNLGTVLFPWNEKNSCARSMCTTKIYVMFLFYYLFPSFFFFVATLIGHKYPRFIRVH